MAVRRKKAGNDFLLIDALKELCAEKSIPEETLFTAIEEALANACKKNSNADKNVIVDLDRDSGVFHVYEVRDVVMDVNNPYKEISVYDAKAMDPRYEVGDQVRKEVSPENFGRIAAQTAKQSVMQKIREAERGVVFDEFSNKDNDMVTGTVTRVEDGNVIVDIGKTEAVLVPVEQLKSDKFKIGDTVRAFVAEVRKIGKGPQVYLSRTHPGLLKRLLELQVPEIAEGIITIKAITREAGSRAKVAVVSSDPNIDPVGSCLGAHGIRAKAISDELNGEKIEVVKWDTDPAIFIANSLSPSKVMFVAVNEGKKVARAVVPNAQLSVAIGKAGQNARLSARLTGWRVDIKSKAQDKEDPLTPEDHMRIVTLMEERRKQQKKKPFDKNKSADKTDKKKPLDKNKQAGDKKPFDKNKQSGDKKPVDKKKDFTPRQNTQSDGTVTSSWKNKKKKRDPNKPYTPPPQPKVFVPPDFTGFDDVPDFDDVQDIPEENTVAVETPAAVEGDNSMPRFDETPNFGEESAFGDDTPNFDDMPAFDDFADFDEAEK